MIAIFRTSTALTAALVALVLTACGGGDDGSSEEATDPPVATIPLTETEYELDPAEPSVGETGVVAFEITNEGNVEHNLEVETPQGEFELESNIAPGETATLEAEIQEPGEYTIYCPVADHRERGMEGTLTVGGGGGDGAGGSGRAGAPETGAPEKDPDQGARSGGGY